MYYFILKPTNKVARTMIFLPDIKKDDELCGIIFLSKWLYKNKYMRLVCYCYRFVCIGYLSLFLNYATKEWKHLVSIDIAIAAFAIAALLACLSILDEEETFIEVNQMRAQYFWDNNFLNKSEKSKFDRIAKICVYSHFILWILAVILIVSECYDSYRPKYVCPDDWSDLAKSAVTFCVCLSLSYGYYVANSHESFFAYTLLHGYFQMNTLSAYLRNELFKFRKMDLNEKLRSYEYQSVIGGVLLRSIKQHKKLTNYGRRISRIYNKWMVFHFLTALLTFSATGYCYFYDPADHKLTLFLAGFYVTLYGTYYLLVGDLFTDGYEAFYNELSKVEWYALDRTNQRLYYMFLFFAQMTHQIDVLPNLPITRPLLTKTLKMTYTGITLLSSLKSHD